MKKIVLLLFIACVSLPAFAQKEYGLNFSSLISDKLTLENAIRIGLENNSDFLTAQQEVIIAQQKVSEAKFRYLPQLSLEGSATWFDLDYPMVLPDAIGNRFLPGSMLNDDKRFYGVGVKGTQYIYSGGRIKGALKMARANLKQTENRYETVKNQIVLNIKTAFFNMLYAQENAQFTQELWQTVSAWYKGQNAPLWTQIQISALLAQLQSANAQAANRLKQARLELLTSLNKELNAPLAITGDFKPVTVNGDLPRFNLWAMEFRPELKSAIYALELQNISIDLMLSRRYPDIILNASYEQLGTHDLQDENKQVSLAVRLPIPYNFSSQITQKQAEQRKSELKRAQIEDTIRAQVAHSYENMSFWQNETRTRQETYQQLTNLFQKAAKSAAKTGAAPLQAAQAYLQTTQDYLEAVRQNNIAKAELEWAIGKDIN